MSLQDQKRRTRRDSALQDAINDSRFRTNRKIELYKDVCFDDKINELQNDVRHNRCPRLRNRANEHQNRLFYDKIHEKVFFVQFTNFEQRINQICKLNEALYDLKQSSKV